MQIKKIVQLPEKLKDYIHEERYELEKLEELSYGFTELTNTPLFETHP